MAILECGPFAPDATPITPPGSLAEAVNLTTQTADVTGTFGVFCGDARENAASILAIIQYEL